MGARRDSPQHEQATLLRLRLLRLNLSTAAAREGPAPPPGAHTRTGGPHQRLGPWDRSQGSGPLLRDWAPGWGVPGLPLTQDRSRLGQTLRLCVGTESRVL